ncbi:MAG: EpsI family protein [Acidobacteria bacterium]|nr:EpsI family protein [Acidobacteriota bacterium]
MIYRIVIVCVILLAASAFIAHASRPEIIPIRESLSNMPMQIGSWKGVDAGEIEGRVMNVLGVDDYINRVYYNRDRYPTGLYIGYYQSQRSGDTIHSPLNCLPGAGWNPVKKELIPIAIDQKSLKINSIVILKGIQKQLVLYWYQSHGRVIASEYWGKIYTVIDALKTNRTDAALVRIICPIEGLDSDAEEFAQANAVDFVESLFPMLERYLPE